MRPDPSILIVRFSSLGDVVLSTAAAAWIKAACPPARVVLATKAAYAPLMEGQAGLDEVWALEPAGLGALVRRARAARFDAIVDLHANLRSRLLGLLAGAPVTRWQPGTLNRRLRVRFKGLQQPEPAPVAQRYARAAAAALDRLYDGGPAKPHLAADPASLAWADAWLGAHGVAPDAPLLAVAPGAAWATKRWPASMLADCLRRVAEGGRTRLLLLGSRAEGPLISAVLDQLGAARGQALRADGETADLRRLLALLARSRHFLGHDSGPMHLAEALGLPLTALFGPTVRGFGFYPVSAGATVFERDLACRPCHLHGGDACPLGHHDCLRGIEPAAVAAQLRAAMGI